LHLWIEMILVFNVKQKNNFIFNYGEFLSSL